VIPGPASRRITRRRALVEMVAGAALLAGCGSGARDPAPTGSTIASTWIDPAGTGVLRSGPGEALIARTELGPPRPASGVIATLAHLTDAHVLDASSPARVPFLDRLGEPFESTFRPQETLTAQVLAGATRAILALAPDAVIQGGDLIDNDQRNELRWAMAVLGGGVVRPGSGPRGYYGVQLASNPDPFYYRPDLDAPRHPGLLSAAVRPFRAPGLRTPVYPVLGDHDILVAGELAPTDPTRALARGGEALWELPPGLSLPAGTPLTAGGSPDGPPLPGLVHQFLSQALAGPKVRVPSDPRRWEMDAGEVVGLLRAGAGTAEATGLPSAGQATGLPSAGQATGLPSAGDGNALDYHVDIGDELRLIVLDLARRAGGSGGLVRPDQPARLAGQLAGAGERWVIVVSHQPLPGSEGADQLLALLDAHPRVIATLAGHTHANLIEPRGGYWLISTASLIDYPQQARALRVLRTAGGGVAIQTWMLDHTFPGDLGTISRQLAYLDAQGGRPKGFAGGRLDRNVTLYLRG
jgi:3',5'-cyclic AMP phosphodiesterase CpdA